MRSGGLGKALAIGGFFTLSLAVMMLAEAAVLRFAKAIARPESKSVAFRSFSAALSLLIASWGWMVVVPDSDLPYPVTLVHGAQVGMVVGFCWLAICAWDLLFENLTLRVKKADDRAERLLQPILRKLVATVIVVVGLIVVLTLFSVDWRGMLAGLGIGGLLVALAAKDSVENLFGSITILFDMPFAIGDLVKVAGYEGVIEEINLRSTRIRTLDDAVVTLPNSNLIKASVENFGARRMRRQRILLRVSLRNAPDSLDKLRSAVYQLLVGTSGIVHERTLVAINDVAETSLGLLIICYIDTQDYAQELAARDSLLMGVLRACQEFGIQFVEPVPTRAVGP